MDDEPGMRVKGHDDALPSYLRSEVIDTADEFLMALVHSIKGAYGHYSVSEGRQVM